MSGKNLFALPKDLPVPVDDGAAAHLKGTAIPDIALPSTHGGPVELDKLPGRTIVYAYPRTGQPKQILFVEEWDQIPGARGCTPESCAFRDHYAELREAGAQEVFGFSTQDTDYQREAVERLHLPFALLSDAELLLTRALRLPTFRVRGVTLVKRMTLVVRDGRIEHVFYPVFPPDGHAEAVLNWMRANPV
ncbi:MAG: peroxiredoxin [Pseudomonadota bacterium]|nr:peroxiredoxin [Pseudomonadota bacterium]